MKNGITLALLAVCPSFIHCQSDAENDTAFYGQSPPVYPSPQGQGRGAWREPYKRASALVSQMTLEERSNVTIGFDSESNTCSGNSGSVPRLGFPGMCLQDAGNGVRDAEFVNAYASGIHVGASWDKRLTYQRGWHMGNEFRIKGANVALGPNAGPLGRVPLGGRNWEGFSVDPYLSGILNAETIKGTQDAGVITSLKHLIGNEQETLRRPYFGIEAASSNIDDKTMHEYYLWPFMDGVKAGAASIMCSYQRLNNSYGCQNSKLLNGLLKTELEFDGFVLADWNAQHSGVGSALAGLDMNMPTGGYWGENLTDAVGNGSVGEARLTDMATRILAAWYFTGQDGGDFDEPGRGIQNLTLPHERVNARRPEAKPTLLEGSIAGHVLVKNIGHALPLKKPEMLSLFGYDAHAPPTKSVDVLFTLGYYSSPEMAEAELGTEQHFLQYAPAGTIITGGRAGANAPPYIDSPFDAITRRARSDDTWLNWDFNTTEPLVNPTSDACLVFINAISTEGWDREGLRDGYSDDIVQHVASQCSNTMVIIHTVGIRLVDTWYAHPNITAIMIAHLPGQDSGEALVQLLYGDAVPSGKLPYTVARSEEDYSVYEPCRNPRNETFPQCDFDEGVYLDYRDFDAKNVTPRFEFGFGLSYTSFSYSSLSLQGHEAVAAGQPSDIWSVVLRAQANITNTGSVGGAEVAQLYLSIPNSPVKQLRGFDKPFISVGSSAMAHFELTQRDLSVWDVEAQSWVIQSGRYVVMVGASSRDIRLTYGFEI